MNAGVYTLRWLLAWAVALILIGLINRTRLGHLAIFYLLTLALVLLIVQQAGWFQQVLSPITGLGTPPETGAPGTGDTRSRTATATRGAA